MAPRKAAFKRKRTPRYRSKKLTKPQTRQVKAIVARQITNKQNCFYSRANVLFYASALSIKDTATLTPTIAYGTTNGTRNCNVLKIKSWMMKIRFYIPQGSAATEPLLVRVLILNNKLAPASQPNNFADLFRAGATTVGIQNNDLDMMFPTNQYKFNVYYDKQFKLGQSSVVTGDPQAANNDFKLSVSKSIQLSKFMKTAKYNDQEVDQPSNRNMYMLILTARVGGSTGTASADSTLRYSYITNFIYEDN